MRKLLIILFFTVLVLTPLAVVHAGPFDAAVGKLGDVNSTVGLSGNFQTSVATIIQGALSLVGTIFLILAVYAGILWMTAQGNEEKVTKAKDIVTQAIIGLAITLGAYAITYFVTSKLNSGTTSSGGSSISTTAACKAKTNYACYTDCVAPHPTKQVGTCGDTTTNEPVCCSQ